MDWVLLAFALAALGGLAVSLRDRYRDETPEERWRRKYDQKLKKFHQWY